MDLSIYDIVKGLCMSNKSSALFGKLGKLTFEVHRDANKSMIRNAVEKIWDVKVAKVCVVNTKGKQKSFARKEFKTPDRKKAIVTLKEGYKIKIPGQFETMGVGAESKGETAKGK